MGEREREKEDGREGEGGLEGGAASLNKPVSSAGLR